MSSFKKQHQAGVTLIELMVTVAIIGIISAIALPMYNDYITTSRAGILSTNIQTIKMMQDERRREFGEYAEGLYIPGGSTTLTTSLGWAPGTDTDEVSYTVTCDTDGGKTGECARSSGYTVVASHSAAPTETVTRTYAP